MPCVHQAMQGGQVNIVLGNEIATLDLQLSQNCLHLFFEMHIIPGASSGSFSQCFQSHNTYFCTVGNAKLMYFDD